MNMTVKVIYNYNSVKVSLTFKVLSNRFLVNYKRISEISII
jgi:hypothetical protein